MSTMGNPVSDTDENGLRLGQETEELHHDRVSLALGKVMHQARQANEWTQKDLATRVNEKPPVVTEYENEADNGQLLFYAVFVLSFSFSSKSEAG
ncbi:hypothetical protein QR680_012774 [Steinernema hermaphroditum]|uniref:HTH cro/C1-type domain-containing protein n=1 Tax=Steinernema hermaphroditum TaxID=289476 RepID=A0AA39I359_9BILA|nr:hypothetical protein QR680_012774 [Steinernema hermaphroditum]